MSGAQLSKALTLVALYAGSASAAIAEGDAAAGERVFNQCRACHSLEEGDHGVGPSLYNVVGQPAGAADGFRYSSALADSGLTWDHATLSAFLMDPRGTVRGNRMSFPGVDADEAADVIAFIEANSN